MKFDNLIMSDAQIIEMNLDLSSSKFILRTWDDKEWLIIFEEVLAIQSFSVEGVDLSHLVIGNDDPFKTSTMEYFHDENFERFLCFNFYGVWVEKPLLKIIATGSYEIIENS
ncbi:MAG: hypothetical protein RR617_07830 [Anaerovoracaceae bacterium]